MDKSRKPGAFSLRSRVVDSCRQLGAGFFSLPTVSPLEGFFLRFLFGLVVALTISLQVPFHEQPHPVGLAHFFDLTWLSNPRNLSLYRGVIYLLLIFYAAGCFLPI